VTDDRTAYNRAQKAARRAAVKAVDNDAFADMIADRIARTFADKYADMIADKIVSVVREMSAAHNSNFTTRNEGPNGPSFVSGSGEPRTQNSVRGADNEPRTEPRTDEERAYSTQRVREIRDDLFGNRADLA
jgi:hypothetical protein